MKLEIVGGVLDGTAVVTSARPGWGWIDPDGRVWRACAPRRSLHRLLPALPDSEHDQVYLYAEAAYRRCSGCDVFHRAPAPPVVDPLCTLCGCALVAVQ